MRELQSKRRLLGDTDLVSKGQLALRLGQKLAVDVLHRDIGLALDLADLEDLADPGMLDARQGTRLLQEALLESLVLARDKLQRDDAQNPPIARLVDRPHPAMAQDAEELVAVPVGNRKAV